jgi:hypothetical protein
MGMKSVLVDCHLIIEPKRAGDLGGGISVPDKWMTDDPIKEKRDRCQEILDQAKRHVDNIGYSYIKEEREDQCEFCGYRWTEGKESKHNGGCCDKDCIIFEQENPDDNTANG